MANILGLVGVGVSGLALLFAILAMSLPDWESATINGSDVSIGLWKFCYETNGNKECTTIDSDSVQDEVPRDFHEVRATVFLGIIFTASAIVPAILVMFVLQTKKVLYFVAAGLNVAAGLFLMIAMAVYAGGAADDDTYGFDACFVLDIIAWLAAWVGGGLFVGAKLTEKQ